MRNVATEEVMFQHLVLLLVPDDVRQFEQSFIDQALYDTHPQNVLSYIPTYTPTTKESFHRLDGVPTSATTGIDPT